MGFFAYCICERVILESKKCDWIERENVYEEQFYPTLNQDSLNVY